MSAPTSVRPEPAVRPAREEPPPRRRRRALRRLLRAQDRRSAHLAELHGIDAVLAAAAVTLDRGWIQNAWFAYDDEEGRHVVTAYDVHRLTGHPVAAACLVGAVVDAAGGPTVARGQLVQRTLDVTWHALCRESDEPVRWGPSPGVRVAHIRELTRWNDSPARRVDDVLDLLGRARSATMAEATRQLSGTGSVQP